MTRGFNKSLSQSKMLSHLLVLKILFFVYVIGSAVRNEVPTMTLNSKKISDRRDEELRKSESIASTEVKATGLIEAGGQELHIISGNGSTTCSKLQLLCVESGLTYASEKCNIQVKGLLSFKVSCEDEWIVIQRRLNGSIDFNRDWLSYKNGFGNLEGEFWLGLDKIHALSVALAPAELYIQMIDFDDIESYAAYDNFRIGNEIENFKLISLGDISGYAENSLVWHECQDFTTHDRDNDKNAAVNCAQSLSGGWWFFICDPELPISNLNGQYYEDDLARNTPRQNGVIWSTFGGSDNSLKFVQMMIK